MGCLFSLIELFLWLTYYSVVAICYIVALIFHLIKGIVNLIPNKNGKKTANLKSNIEFVDYGFEESKVINKSKNKSSWFDNKFEKEADLWWLSKEARRIAKEERMSPADFIEVEEYDDDELFKDEWER